jgi:DNA polymerase III epsilon subunit-like protein
MNFVSVDVESDGPIPGKYSMISLGAVVCTPPFNDSFYCTIRPVTDEYIPEALAVSGFTREETLKFNTPEVEIARFNEWLKDLKLRKGYQVFIADNNGFDWSFTNYYLHYYTGENPFGYSSWNLNSFYKGIEKDYRAKFKKYRVTKHTHNALDDAIGNAEALHTILTKHGFEK